MSSNHHYKLKNHYGVEYYAKAKTSYARLRSFASCPRPNKIAAVKTTKTTPIRFKDIDLGDPIMAGNINKVKKIIGLEIVKQATIDAAHNANLNKFENAIFKYGKVEDLITSFKKEKIDSDKKIKHKNHLHNEMKLN